MTAWAWLDSGFHFDLLMLPLMVLSGLVALRVRAVRARRRERRAMQFLRRVR